MQASKEDLHFFMLLTFYCKKKDCMCYLIKPMRLNDILTPKEPKPSRNCFTIMNLQIF